MKALQIKEKINYDILQKLKLIENGKKAYSKASPLSKEEAIKEIDIYRKKAINNLNNAIILDNYIKEMKDCTDREKIIAEARNEEAIFDEEPSNPKYEEERQNFVKEINSWLN